MPVAGNILVSIDENSNAERYIRRFKRLCDNYGVVREYRKRQEYKKPSVKSKEKLEAAEKRRRKMFFRTKRSGKI